MKAPEYLKSEVIEEFMGLDRIRFRELVEGSLQKVFIVFRALCRGGREEEMRDRE